jgi:hypothetical protein
MALLVPLQCDRLETVDPTESFVKIVVDTGVTRERRRFTGVGVLDSGLGLFVDVLAKVSTKLDLIDRATEDNVARRRRVRSVGEGVLVALVEEAKISAVRCSIVIQAFCACLYFWDLGWRQLAGQYQRLVRRNRVGIRVRPRFHAAVDGSLYRLRETDVWQTTSIGSGPRV